MARTFTITCAAGTIRLAGEARGECTFTITNSSAAPARAHPSAVALDARAQGWFNLIGDPVRELTPGQTVQVGLSILPSGAPPGRYCFRLDVLPAEGGERSTGPEVCVELTSAAPAAAVGSRPFPWWILLVAAGVLLALALVLWLVLRDGGRPAAAAVPVAAGQPVAAGGAAPAPGTGSPADAQALAERWLAAFEDEQLTALSAMTSAPALIAGQRAEDERAIARLYSSLLRQDRSGAGRLAQSRSAVRKPAPAPTLARLRDLGTRLPAGARALGLGDDDHALAVTVAGSGLQLVLLIRAGPPLRIAGVVP